MERLIIILLLLGNSYFSFGQNLIYTTFKDTRIIHTHSVETLQKRKLDIRIGHRFGNLKGGWNTLYGLEAAQDVMMGVDYGLTDYLNIGLHRTKGTGPLTQLVNTSLKYRVVKQTHNSSPVSITALGIWTVSSMQKDASNEFIFNNFKKFKHRFVNAAQLLIARKFSDRFSLQITPSYVHRNIVAFDEQNGIFSFGIATRIQLTKVLGIIIDSTTPLYTDTSKSILGIGLEIDTGGHVFQLNFINARGISETDYIPNNQATWMDGQIRFGFTISRIINL